MSWLAPSDLLVHLSQTVLTQLSTGQGRAASEDDSVIQKCLDFAEGQVRGLLSGRIALPDADPGGLLHDITVYLAIESLFLRQPGEAAKLPEGWQTAVKNAHNQLDRMVDGSLPIPTQVAETRMFASLHSHSLVNKAFKDLLS
jgi:phage gp36-like protein